MAGLVSITIPGFSAGVRPESWPKRGKEMRSLSCGVCQENTLGLLGGGDSRAEDRDGRAVRVGLRKKRLAGHSGSPAWGCFECQDEGLGLCLRPGEATFKSLGRAETGPVVGETRVAMIQGRD